MEIIAPQPQASDETLIVYLRRLEFLTPVQALQYSTTARADALVLSEATLEKTRGLLAPVLPFDRPTLISKGQDEQPSYILVERDPSLPPLTVPLRAPAEEETPVPRKRAIHKKKP